MALISVSMEMTRSSQKDDSMATTSSALPLPFPSPSEGLGWEVSAFAPTLCWLACRGLAGDARPPGAMAGPLWVFMVEVVDEGVGVVEDRLGSEMASLSLYVEVRGLLAWLMDGDRGVLKV